MMASARVIVLDAMGVIYRARDDVAELLVPFVERHGSSAGVNDVAAHLDADAFWRALDLDPSVEDDCLAGHDLSVGLLAFLEVVRSSSIDVWCLSNDLSRWSVKLRERFALDGLFAGFVISGDIGYRKPLEQAYLCLLRRLGGAPELFVDDRPRNVSVARSMGIPSVCFGPGWQERGVRMAYRRWWTARVGSTTGSSRTRPRVRRREARELEAKKLMRDAQVRMLLRLQLSRLRLFPSGAMARFEWLLFLSPVEDAAQARPTRREVAGPGPTKRAAPQHADAGFARVRQMLDPSQLCKCRFLFSPRNNSGHRPSMSWLTECPSKPLRTVRLGEDFRHVVAHACVSDAEQRSCCRAGIPGVAGLSVSRAVSLETGGRPTSRAAPASGLPSREHSSSGSIGTCSRTRGQSQSVSVNGSRNCACFAPMRDRRPRPLSRPWTAPSGGCIVPFADAAASP